MAMKNDRMRLSDQSVSYLNKLIRDDYIVEQQLYNETDFSHRLNQSRSLSSSTSIATNPLNHYGRAQPYTPHGSGGINLEDQLRDKSANKVTQSQIIQLCENIKNVGQLNNPSQFNGTVNQGGSEFNNGPHGMTNPYYYSHVLISRLALQQILGHAIKGNEIEVMGILLGITLNNKFIVTRTFELPVEGTETRVNAQSESYEYMVQYVSQLINDEDELPTNEKVVGWYHSHPGYDCWLSGIDMRTQDLNQSFQDPYVAIVVDPLKSDEEGKLSIGAFRTIKNDSSNDTSGVEDLSFYALTVGIFDSHLNKCIDELKLTFNYDMNEHYHKKEMAYSLTKSLLDIMKQIQTITSCQKEKTLEEGDVLENANKNILHCQTFCSSGDHHNNNNVSNNGQYRDGINNAAFNKSPCESMVSLTSLGNNSDEEIMHNEIDIEMESVNSSVFTGTDTGSTHPQHHDLFRSPHFNTLLQQHVEQRSEMSSLLSKPTYSSGDVDTAQQVDAHPTSTGSQMDLTAVAIEKEHEVSSYIHIKKTLLRLQMQKYKNLRLYRDAFTL